MAYEIHSSAGLNLLNSQLFKLGLKPGKIYYDNDFRNKIIKRFLKHPVLFTKLFHSRLLSLTFKVLKTKRSHTKSDKEFEPGMQYAWRD